MALKVTSEKRKRRKDQFLSGKKCTVQNVLCQIYLSVLVNITIMQVWAAQGNFPSLKRGTCLVTMVTRLQVASNMITGCGCQLP